MANNELAYGFVGLQHLYNNRVSEVGVERVWTAIQESLNEHNRSVDGMLADWVFRTERAKEQFELPGDGTLQPLDEWGNPRPVREGGYYNVAYPILGGGTAFGSNRVARALQTVEEVNRQMVESMRRDADWLRRHMLAAILDETSWTFTDKVGPNGSKGLGDIDVEPLANSDTVTYNIVGGSSSTDDHYLAQAADISDSENPFSDIYDELIEHPSNSGPVVVYAAHSLVSDIEGLTAFNPTDDPEIIYGAQTDRIGSSPFPRGIGDELLGRIEKCWVIDWRALPDDYMVAVAQGAGSFMAMREYPAPELKGLFTEEYSPDGNLEETRLLRYAGFGIRNRIAALVQYIGSGSYAVPSGYDAPLAL